MFKSGCEKRDCYYYWQDENESHPRCHFEQMADWDLPPCECDDEPFEPEEDEDDEPFEPEEDEDAVYEPDDIDSDEGFDPYEGCFTWDC